MVFIAILAICAFIPTTAVGSADTCDASDPSKCMSGAGTEQAAKGDALLQAVHTKARATDIHEDVHQEPRSQLEANFNEVTKHAAALSDRLEMLLVHKEEEPLEPDVEERVHTALSLLEQAQRELKTLRSKHAALIQNPGNDHKSHGSLLESMSHIQKIATEAEDILSGVDDGAHEDDVHDEHEDEDEDEEEEDEDDEEDPEALLQEGAEEEEDEDDEEEDGEDDEEDEDHDDHHEEHHEEDHQEDISEVQKGSGVQYEPEEDQKSIERH